MNTLHKTDKEIIKLLLSHEINRLWCELKRMEYIQATHTMHYQTTRDLHQYHTDAMSRFADACKRLTF